MLVEGFGAVGVLLCGALGCLFLCLMLCAVAAAWAAWPTRRH
jgi:hypothetical protein